MRSAGSDRSAIPHYVISMAGIGQRRPGGRRAAQGGRARAPAPAAHRQHVGRPAARHRAAVRDDRRPRSFRRDADGDVEPPDVPLSSSTPAGRCRRSWSGTPTRTRTAATSRRSGTCTPPRPSWSTSATAGRRAAPALPRPGRHGRTRRRAGVPGDPGPAAALGRSHDPPHRAGRDGRRQVLASGLGASQPRDAPRGDARGVVPRRGSATNPSIPASRRPWMPCRRAAFTEYRSLVYDDARFVDFFRSITPTDEIATLNVGSRPASRTASRAIEDLRAIPWVFGWTQCRLMIPGWYGAGTAFDAVGGAPTIGPTTASRCCRRCTPSGRASTRSSTTWAWCWPSPTSRSGAATPTCSSRTTRPATRSSSASSDEHARTLRWHAVITGSDDPLADNPVLARSLRNRYPYLDPLHVMQVELLRRYREGDHDPLVQRGIQLTINAIATGIRNSGLSSGRVVPSPGDRSAHPRRDPRHTAVSRARVLHVGRRRPEST